MDHFERVNFPLVFHILCNRMLYCALAWGKAPGDSSQTKVCSNWCHGLVGKTLWLLPGQEYSLFACKVSPHDKCSSEMLNFRLKMKCLSVLRIGQMAKQTFLSQWVIDFASDAASRSSVCTALCGYLFFQLKTQHSRPHTSIATTIRGRGRYVFATVAWRWLTRGAKDPWHCQACGRLFFSVLQIHSSGTVSLTHMIWNTWRDLSVSLCAD